MYWEVNNLKEYIKSNSDEIRGKRNLYINNQYSENIDNIYMSIIDKEEKFILKNSSFIKQELINNNILGTALINILNDYSKVKNIISKYIDKCLEAPDESNDSYFKTMIIKPLFSKLAKLNIYFNIMHTKEIETYSHNIEQLKHLKLLQNKNINEEVIYSNKNNKEQDVITLNMEILKLQTIKTYTIDYLQKYLEELKEACEILSILFQDFKGAKYNFSIKEKKLLLKSNINYYFDLHSIKFSTDMYFKVENEYLTFVDAFTCFVKNTSKYKVDPLTSFFDYLKNVPTKLNYSYKIDTIYDIVYVSLIKIIDNSITIKKCKNCDKIFITKKRSDEVYCDNISPQNKEKSCKEYIAKRTYKEQISDSKVDYEYLKIAQLLRMRKSRTKNNKEIELYEKKAKKLYIEFKEKKELYKNGKLSENELLNWLEKQQLEKRKAGRKKNGKGGDSNVK